MQGYLVCSAIFGEKCLLCVLYEQAGAGRRMCTFWGKKT